MNTETGPDNINTDNDTFVHNWFGSSLNRNVNCIRHGPRFEDSVRHDTETLIAASVA